MVVTYVLTLGGARTRLSDVYGGPANVVDPAISGSARDGHTLTLDDGDWTGTPALVPGYQWQRCDADGSNCADIAGHTAQDYTLGSAEIVGTGAPAPHRVHQEHGDHRHDERRHDHQGQVEIVLPVGLHRRCHREPGGCHEDGDGTDRSHDDRDDPNLDGRQATLPVPLAPGAGRCGRILGKWRDEGKGNRSPCELRPVASCVVAS